MIGWGTVPFVILAQDMPVQCLQEADYLGALDVILNGMNLGLLPAQTGASLPSSNISIPRDLISGP
jgi:hypothetical protein